MSKMELRLTGSGGQGVILASIILADVALQNGYNVAQSQSYGPEARGGMCKAETVISKEQIGYTKVINPTFLLALTKPSLDKYSENIDENCTLLIDGSLEITNSTKSKNIFKADILKAAKEQVGKSFTANIVAVAVINKLLKLSSFEKLKEVVLNYIPKGTEEINMKALQVGNDLPIIKA